MMQDNKNLACWRDNNHTMKKMTVTSTPFTRSSKHRANIKQA